MSCANYITKVVAIFILSSTFSLAKQHQVDKPNILKIDIDDAISLTLSKNYFVKVRSFDPEIEKQFIDFNKGTFEPVVGLTYRLEETDVLENTGNINDKQDKGSTTLFLNGVMPWGTEYLLEVNQSKDILRDSRSHDFDSLIEISQPLLKGFGVNEGLASTRLAINRFEIQSWIFKDVVMDTVRDVAIAYANLYAAQKNLEVRVESRNLAQQLLNDNRKRASVGRDAESEIVTAQASVASRENAVVNAERTLLFAENQLKQYISDDLLPLLSYRVETSGIDHFDEPKINIRNDFKNSLTLRPDYQQAKLGINASHIEVKRDKQRSLPTLNITFRAKQFGKGNTSSNARDVFDHQKPRNFTTTLEFSTPITRKSGRAQLRASELALQQAELDIKYLEQGILLDIDNAASNLSTDWNSLQITKQAVEYAEKSLSAAEKLRKAGRSTSFVVLRFQNDLERARNDYFQAKTAYFRSIINYHYAVGDILHFFKVEIPYSKN